MNVQLVRSLVCMNTPTMYLAGDKDRLPSLSFGKYQTHASIIFKQLRGRQKSSGKIFHRHLGSVFPTATPTASRLPSCFL